MSYRYVQEEGSWNLIRFELNDESTPADRAKRTLTARDLLPPGIDWSPGDAISHAATVSTSNDNREVEIAFASGSRLRVLGTVSDWTRTSASTPTTESPSLPSARCGGSIAIVLNTSSAIWSQGAAGSVTADLSGFVNEMRGTSTYVRIVAFDRLAYSLYPDLTAGTYVHILDSSTSLTALHNKLTALSTTSGSWRNGRNWEDGIWQATRRDTGQLFSQVPDLIIFITDGSPNRNRTNTSSDTDTTFHTADLTRAIAAADYARSVGSTLVGVLMGSAATETAASHLRSVFGSSTWDGSVAVLPPDRARSFTRPPAEGFSRLDEVLRLIGQWRCSGTVTLQKRLLAAGTPTDLTDSWSFEVDANDVSGTQLIAVHPTRVSNAADFGAGNSDRVRSITIAQTARVGFRHLSMSCTRSGISIPLESGTGSDGRTWHRLNASAADMVSCTSISEAMQ